MSSTARNSHSWLFRAALALLFLGLNGPLLAGALPIQGKGKKTEILTTGFPKEQVERYRLFKSRCTRCHDMDRPIYALEKGATPISGQPFNKKEIKRYVVKMMRKANSGISKKEARELIFFLSYLRELAEKGS